MEEFTSLTVDTPPVLSTEDVSFATIANIGSGKVAGSPSDSSLLLQLRISVASTAKPPWCLTNETTISNIKAPGGSAGLSPFVLAPKKSQQVQRLEFAAAAWDAIGRRFQESLQQDRARSVECLGLEERALAPSKSDFA